MKVGLLIREKIIGEIKEKTKQAQGCLFIGFNKVGAFSFNRIRNRLKEAGASVAVTKNSLFKRAFHNLGWENLEGFIDQESGIVLIHDEDAIKICKVLVDCLKEDEALQLRGGFLKDKRITHQEVNTLAKLPSREYLYSMVVSSIASPLTGFISTLNQIIVKFLQVVEEIKKKNNDGNPK